MEPAISRALLLAVLVGACHGSVAEDLQGFLQVRSFLSQRNEQQYKIATANGIDEARYVPVGGGEQYISIRGEDRANPVILFLHGGPGDATNPWGYLAFRSCSSTSQSCNGISAAPAGRCARAEDFTTPTSLAQEFVASLRAPRKAFVAIPGGHFAVFMRSDEFLRELVARLRPLAL
jgi:hypothetical protein